MPRLPSLALRLFATYLAAVLATAALIAGVLAGLVAWRMDLLTRQYLDHEAGMIGRHLSRDAAGRPAGVDLPADVAWYFAALAADLKYRVVDGAGVVLVSSDPGGAALAPAGERYAADRPLFTLSTEGGVRLQVLTEPVRGASDCRLQVATSDRLAALVRFGIGAPVLRAAVVIAGASVALLAVVLWFGQKRMLRPLREASAAAAAIRPRTLGARLGTRDLPSELAPLIGAFDQALDRLEQGFRVQQAFLAAAAHELKTPLALIRGQIEVDGAAGDPAALLRDVDTMARQVHQLLHLAEVSEPQNFVFGRVEIAAVAAEVLAWAERLAEPRRVRLVLAAAPGLPALRADRGALFVLLKNLVENAIRHSPDAGRVLLRAEAGRIVVADEGPGLAAADLPHLFVRFWRGADRRDDGAGLGLAIAREIAEAHGWRLRARDTGRGAEFEIVFGAV